MRSAVEEQIKEALSREVSAQEGLLTDFYAQRMGMPSIGKPAPCRSS